MATARQLMDIARIKVEANKPQAAEFGAVYKFVLDGEGGGTFLIDLTDDPGITESDGEAECVIKMAAGDFVQMIENGSDPRALLFRGKLKIEGNLGLANKLRQFTDMFSS